MKEAVFIVDLAKCTGCYTCVVACHDRADMPDRLAIARVQESVSGSYPTPSLTYRLIHCFHCADPTCVSACPTQAIVKRPTGQVEIIRDLCLGCLACGAACPFRAIVLMPDGTAAKCDRCQDQIDLGQTPTCVRACPMRALRYEPFEETGQDRVVDAEFHDHGIGPAVVYLRRPRRGQ
jgi:anaerobic dimethyl sulfoxide reductase subunit B (iron-sulfur subunit)